MGVIGAEQAERWLYCSIGTLVLHSLALSLSLSRALSLSLSLSLALSLSLSLSVVPSLSLSALLSLSLSPALLSAECATALVGGQNAGALQRSEVCSHSVLA